MPFTTALKSQANSGQRARHARVRVRGRCRRISLSLNGFPFARERWAQNGLIGGVSDARESAEYSRAGSIA